MKKCTGCFLVKSMDDFYPRKCRSGSTRHLVRPKCKVCERLATQKFYQENGRIRTVAKFPVKVCSRCKIEKETEAFYRYNDGSIKAECKECTKAGARKHYLANRTAIRMRRNILNKEARERELGRRR